MTDAVVFCEWICMRKLQLYHIAVNSHRYQSLHIYCAGMHSIVQRLEKTYVAQISLCRNGNDKPQSFVVTNIQQFKKLGTQFWVLLWFYLFLFIYFLTICGLICEFSLWAQVYVHGCGFGYNSNEKKLMKTMG